MKSLFFICRILSPDTRPETNDELRAKMNSASPDWETALLVAGEYLVTPTVWKALEVKGLADLVPKEVRTYLSEVHRLNAERNRRIKEQTVEALRKLNSSGIEPILLKGGVGLFVNWLRDPGSRIMVDVDFLVKPECSQKALEVFVQLGYTPAENHVSQPRQYRHHLEPLVRPGDPAFVELHTRLEHAMADIVINTGDVWINSRVIEVDRIAFRILSPYHFILHEVIHSQVNEARFHLGSIDVRHLYDLAEAWAGLVQSVDWQRVMATFRKHDMEIILLGYLFMAHRLFGIVMPDSVQPNLRTRFHYIRCLMQVYLPRNTMTRILLQIVSDFSALQLTRRFGCANTFRDLTKWRRYLFMDLCKRYIFQRQDLSLVHLPLAGNVSHMKMFSRKPKRSDGR